MRRTVLLTAIALAGALAAPAAAEWTRSDSVAVRSSAPSDPRATREADSLVTAILGPYVSDADPKGHVSIGSLGRGVVVVTWGSSWDAVGYWDGREFRGVSRSPIWGNAREISFGELRFRAAGRETLVARVELGGSSRTERWVRVRPSESRRETREEPSRRLDPDLPAFGEYVYVEELPEAITKVSPSYPDAARRQSIEGTVIVQALVGRDGRVRDTRVDKSIPGLDDAAVACVRQWVFRPARAKGEPVAVWVAIPVKFTLR